MTGALNRLRHPRRCLPTRYRACERPTAGAAYLDLDRFKLINDLFGHVAGDEVLKQVCGRVREMLADGHDIGRVGSESSSSCSGTRRFAYGKRESAVIVEWIAASPIRLATRRSRSA